MQARNAFCAVRPPGHHAGPTGVVTCENDPLGSHGFCLFNNVAVGGAYALNVHRHHGTGFIEVALGSLAPSSAAEWGQAGHWVHWHMPGTWSACSALAAA